MNKNGLKRVVKLSNDMFIEMHDLTDEQLESAFYFSCYVMGKHALANETISIIEDPFDKAGVVVRALSIAYCRLGKKAIKKATTKKAKKLFSQDPNLCGDFIETGVHRLWISIEDKELQQLTNNMIAVVVPRANSFVIMKKSELINTVHTFY
ncbi:MAG: hypothetical protein HRT51_19615 [Colwellia sp.]|nr:hypothetical protein [Colwellia sp.]